MNRRTFKWSLFLIIAATLFIVSQLERKWRNSTSRGRNLIVGISPYQDLAMLTTYKKLKLDDKYGLDLEIKTLPWEDVQVSLASAGKTIDIGFGSLIEFVTKNESLNKGSSDPLVFVFPAYVFKGGGFVTFRKDVPNIDRYAESSRGLGSIPRETVEKFLSFKIGAQKNSMWDMMIYRMCDQHKIDVSSVKITDIPTADALLAAESGSLDLAGAGLTQRNEALERGGSVVFTMDKFGFADITGFICKKSTLEKRREEVESLIQIWFECVEFVQSDLDNNSEDPIKYLDQHSSTRYTVEAYKRALESEYMPRSAGEAVDAIVSEDGQYNMETISKTVSEFLIGRNLIEKPHQFTRPIQLRDRSQP